MKNKSYKKNNIKNKVIVVEPEINDFHFKLCILQWNIAMEIL
jgi:hypothetical protein